MSKQTKVIDVTAIEVVSPEINTSRIVPVAKPQKKQPDNMLSIVKAVIENPDMDIARIQAAIDMRNSELARLAQIAFSEAFVEMGPHLPIIEKLHYNEHTKSFFSKLEDINEKVKPILYTYGFSILATVAEQTETSVTVKVTLIHRQGHSEYTTLTLPLDTTGPNGSTNKSKVHGTTSSIQYAKRVAICAILNISTGGDKDGNLVDENGTPVEKKKAQSMQHRVMEGANKSTPPAQKKPAPKPQQEEHKWDKKTIYLLANNTHIQEFKSSEEAATKLLELLANYKKKSERADIIALNLAIIRALVKKNNAALIDSLHKFADQGE